MDYPFRLPLPKSKNHADHSDEIVARCRSVPLGGLAIDAASHYHPSQEVRDAVTKMVRPQLAFDFMGKAGTLHVRPGDDTYRSIEQISTDNVGIDKDSKMPRANLMDVRVTLIETTLRVQFLYSSKVIEFCLVEKLASNFISELKFCEVK